MAIYFNESRITKPINRVVNIEAVLQKAKESGATLQQIESARNISRFEGVEGAEQYLKSCVAGFINT